MASSNLGYREWAIAIYQLTINIEGMASKKLAEDIGVTQKTAQHLAMKIHKAYRAGNTKTIEGQLEIDEI